nr:Uncharacterised protein [Klebsiella pneumoniae]
MEDQSTNCGENARFTRTTLESRGSPIVAGSSFRTRLCSGEPWLPSPASGRGDDAAAVVELSRLLAGAGADRWPTGVRGRRSGALAGHPLPGAAAGRAAAPAGYPEGYGPREKTSSAMSPSRRRSSTPGDSCGRTPSLPGRCRPAPSAEKCPFTADSSQTGNLCY